MGLGQVATSGKQEPEFHLKEIVERRSGGAATVAADEVTEAAAESNVTVLAVRQNTLC